MFRKITIDGFRGIDDFSIEDFRRVNVMVGRNGGGKTSILEAMAFAAAPNAPGNLPKANTWRDMPGANSRSWHSLLTLFSGMDPHRRMLFEYGADEEKASIEVVAIFGTSETDALESGTGAGHEEAVRGLKVRYRVDDGREVETVLELIEPGFQQAGQ